MESQFNSSLSLPSLHADELVWTKKSIEIQQANQLTQSIRKGLDRGSLKRYDKNQMLSFIKPDYGSLGQFITDINLNTDFLRQKKKKYDGQQEIQQKKVRQHIQNKNLNKILSNPQSSSQQRSVACKLLIQRSFEEAFGTSISEFYFEQIQKLEPQQKSILNINSLSEALDEIVNKSQQQSQQKPNPNVLYIKQNFRKNRSFLKDNTFISNQKDNALKKIVAMKNSYRTLNKLAIPNEKPNQYLQLAEKYSNLKQFKKNHHHRQSSYSSTSSHLNNSIFKTFQGKAFGITEKEVLLHNLYEISSESILFSLTQINFETIQEVSIANTSFAIVEVLFLFLDLVSVYSKNLKILVLEDISSLQGFKQKQKLSQKLKAILQNSSQSLQILKLNKIGLETKDFCMLCLGIGSSKKLQLVQLKNNLIDQHGKKSYDVITKFFKKLQINLEGNALNIQIQKSKIKSSRLIPK